MRRVQGSVATAIAMAMVLTTGGALVAQDEDVPQLTKAGSYGDDLKQVVYAHQLEPRVDPRPAIVFFHGGGLVFGSPLQDTEWAETLAEQGFATFLAGYRLFDPDTGENPWPAQLDDAQRAIRWVRAHADEFNVDPERVCAIGHSSGGQLAALVGTTDASGGSDPVLADVSSRADCVVSIAGDVDFTVPSDDQEWTETVRDPLLGGTVEEVPEVWQAASPVYSVDEETAPFLVIHGNVDEGVSVEAARNLVAALTEAGREFVYAEVPANHFDVFDDPATSSLQDAFLAYQLRPEE